MQQYKSIIVEDEPPVANEIKKLITSAHPELQVCAVANHVADGVAKIKQYQPHLVFLDVKLGCQTGFDLLEQVPEPFFETIFITAYSEFAIQALRSSAADYLLKPVKSDELQAALNRAYRRLNHDNLIRITHNKAIICQLLSRHASESVQIGLPVSRGTRVVTISEIVMLEAEGSYCWFYLTGGNTILVTKGLYYYAEQLKEFGFIRCHAANLVNKKYIKELEETDGIIVLILTNSLRIVVSRKYHKSVKEVLRSW